MERESTRPDLPPDELTAVVGRALGEPAAMLESWRATPLTHRVINAVTDSLLRVTGTASVGGERRSWSVVLKVVQAGAPDPDTPFSPSDDPRHWNYWRREPLVYASGILADLPAGLAVPRLLGTGEPSGRQARLWLEDIAGEGGIGWPVSRYGRAARLLGRWQGAYAAGARPLPDAPWLSEGWLRARTPDARLAAPDLVADRAAWRPPLLRDAPAGLSEAVAALWRDRDALLDAIERGPQTLCHRDLWSPNLIARRDARGDEEIVLIDWSQTGNGVLADDAANLAFDSAWMFGTEAADLPTLAALILDEYCYGLRDAGWRGDEAAVRATYAAIAALRFGLLAGPLIAFARDEGRHSLWEGRYGRPVAAIVSQRLAVIIHALALADQGRALLV